MGIQSRVQALSQLFEMDRKGISPLCAIPLQHGASAWSRGCQDVSSLREGEKKRETMQAAGIALSADKGPHEGSSSYLSLPN